MIVSIAGLVLDSVSIITGFTTLLAMQFSDRVMKKLEKIEKYY